MGSNPKSVGFIMTSFNKVNDFEWFQSSIFTVPYCMKLFAFFATSMFCTLHRRNNSLHPCHRAFRVSSITQWIQSLYKIALAFWRINPNWHELRKQEKCSSLVPPRSRSYKTQWAWLGVKSTQLMSIFTSKNVFDTNSAYKIQSQNYKGGKSALPHPN